MHALYACCGICSVVILYGATTFLAVNSVQNASRWFDQKRNCKEWPQNQDDIEIIGPNRQPIACVLPDLSRSRAALPASVSEAKTILSEAYEKCPDREVCNE